MNQNTLSVRELQDFDIDLIVNYWINSDKSFLIKMGVDLNKLPSSTELTQMLKAQLSLPVKEKRSYCIIWCLNEKPIGHSNTNPTKFGEKANMHLHLWNSDNRIKGLGTELLKMTLPLFFENLKLKKLYCEPYALNPAPNKTLEKIGFDFIKEYITIPGSLNFEQPVKKWELTIEKYKKLKL